MHYAQYTVQTGKNRHIEIGTLAYMNHSCHPNVIMNTAKMQIIAARPINASEELTFFYPSTEWEIISPFIFLLQMVLLREPRRVHFFTLNRL